MNQAEPPLACGSLLILGGARSGKSHYAQSMAEMSGLDKVLIATAEAGDAEMAARIDRHRADRDPYWTVVEEPLDLAGALRRERRTGRIVVVDCLTLWLTNVMLAGRDLDAQIAEIAGEISSSTGPVALVSNEVGLGIAPATALGRDFRDWQGRANQEVARVCSAVVFIAAGLPRIMKPVNLPVIHFT